MRRETNLVTHDRHSRAGRAAIWAATLALRGVLIAVLSATLVTARAVEPLRADGRVRQRVRRMRQALPSLAR